MLLLLEVVAVAKSHDPATKLLTKVSAIVSLEKETKEQADAHMAILIKDFLSTDAESYGCIVHDRDIDEDGKLKTLHMHLCFRLKKRTRKSTLINRIANLCEVSTLAVTLDGATSFEGCFQYLIHKNNPEKWQYSIDDVKTNLSEGEVDVVMDAVTTTLDLNLLKAVCLGTDCLVDVIEAVGLSVYQHYRMTIKDVFDWAQAFKLAELKEKKLYKEVADDF